MKNRKPKRKQPRRHVGRRAKRKPGKIYCVTCEGVIADHEPDVMLSRVDTGERVFYHTRCAGGAMVMTMLEPGVWVLTMRHVEEEEAG